jgi:DnaJ-class molecular chaperone
VMETEMIECPECEGTGEIWDDLEDRMVDCDACEGEGEIEDDDVDEDEGD